MLTLIGTAETAGIRIGEHIRKKAGKIRLIQAASEGKLHRAIGFLLSCGFDNPYNLPEDMKAKLYL